MSPPADQPAVPWWTGGVIYQVYPRSFADTNGDGIGDLAGVMAHLDHLAGTDDSLGVDAVWLSPIYPSPLADFGYDISDFSGVAAEYGTLADLEGRAGRFRTTLAAALGGRCGGRSLRR